jgi:hypothetical protein
MKKVAIAVVVFSIIGISQAVAAIQSPLGKRFQCSPAPYTQQGNAGFTVSTMSDMTVFFGEDRNDGLNSVRGTVKLSFSSPSLPDANFAGRMAVLGDLGAKIKGNTGSEFMDLTFGKYKGWDTDLKLSSDPSEISYLVLKRANENLVFAATCSVTK